MNEIQGSQSPTRVVHFVPHSNGGAGRATERLHRALVAHEYELIESVLVTMDNVRLRDTSRHSAPRNPSRARAGNWSRNVLLALYGKISAPGLLSFPSFVSLGVADYLSALNPDIIHVHWLGKSSISILELRAIRTPVVWTMHDSWLATMPEHVVRENPGRNGGISSPIRRVVSRVLRLVFFSSASQFSVISPSRYLERQAGAILGSRSGEIAVIPNAINTQFWTRRRSTTFRMDHNLPPLSSLILIFSGSHKDFGIKGDELLPIVITELLRLLMQSGQDNVHFVSFGGRFASGTPLGTPFTHVGLLNDSELRDLLSESSLLLYPSLFDNFPNIVLEASAVGVPTVSFDTGGISEILGPLAQALSVPRGDVIGMASKAAELLGNRTQLLRTRRLLRQWVSKRFGEEEVAALHRSHYLKALK